MTLNDFECYYLMPLHFKGLNGFKTKIKYNGTGNTNIM